jgi:hypothetical protein
MRLQNYFYIIVLVSLASCSSIRVKDSKTAEGVQFDSYSTFQFVELDLQNREGLPLNDIVIKMIKSNIKEQMELRGYSQSDNNDLAINIGATTEIVQTTRETDFRDARAGYVGQRNYSWSSEEIVVDESEVGTLLIDVVDRASSELIWKCAVSGTIKNNPEKRAERIEEAIRKAFAKYPIQPDK